MNTTYQYEDPDVVYMEPRAWEFIRAWPDVPEALRPAHSRFMDCGLIWIDPNADTGPPYDWPGSLRLTETGQAFKDYLDDVGRVNFFLRKDVKKWIPNGQSDDPLKRVFKVTLPVGRLGVEVAGHPNFQGGLKFKMARLEMAFERLTDALK